MLRRHRGLVLDHAKDVEENVDVDVDVEENVDGLHSARLLLLLTDHHRLRLNIHDFQLSQIGH